MCCCEVGRLGFEFEFSRACVVGTLQTGGGFGELVACAAIELAFRLLAVCRKRLRAWKWRVNILLSFLSLNLRYKKGVSAFAFFGV